jgi:MoxR-like ATPase
LRRASDPLASVAPVCDKAEIARLQAAAREVEVKEGVAKYMLAIVHRTRAASQLDLGISPRGTIAFYRAAQARALLQGRTYASPDDVHALAGPVLAHRVQLTTEARYGGVTAEKILADLVKEVPVRT